MRQLVILDIIVSGNSVLPENITPLPTGMLIYYWYDPEKNPLHKSLFHNITITFEEYMLKLIFNLIWEWMINFVPNFIKDVIVYPFGD